MNSRRRAAKKNLPALTNTREDRAFGRRFIVQRTRNRRPFTPSPPQARPPDLVDSLDCRKSTVFTRPH